MLEITINGEVYSFRFGIKFLEEVNQIVTRKVEGYNGLQEELGLNHAVGSLLDYNPIMLIKVLDIANKTEKPRVTRAKLESYLEDECEDIEKLFEDVMNCLKSAAVTKKPVEKILKNIEEQLAKQKAEEAKQNA